MSAVVAAESAPAARPSATRIDVLTSRALGLGLMKAFGVSAVLGLSLVPDRVRAINGGVRVR